MERERGVDIRVVEEPLIDHVARAGEALLARLERESDGAGEIASCGEDSGRADEHGDVCVVAACVHRAVDGARVLGSCVLGHRQRVHVGAEQDRGPGSWPGQVGDDGRRRRARADVEAEAVERGEDRGLRAWQLEPELGLGVDTAAEGDRIGQHCCRGLEELLHRRTLRPSSEPLTDSRAERSLVLRRTRPEGRHQATEPGRAARATAGQPADA